MIDWPGVALNALWVLGCAVILAAFSYTRWLAQLRGARTRQLLSAPPFQLSLTVGLLMISLALLLLSAAWLERGLWALFALLFGWQAWGIWRPR